MNQLDYAKWLPRTQWTLIEATCLAVGVEPSGRDRPAPQIASIEDEGIRQRFEDVYRELKSAIRNEKQMRANGFTDVEESRTGPPGNKRVLPSEFAVWLVRAEFAFDIPKNFVNWHPRKTGSRRERHATALTTLRNCWL